MPTAHPTLPPMHATSERPRPAPFTAGRPGVAVAVLALHVLLALALWQTLRWRSVAVPREPSSLVWVQPTAPPAKQPPLQADAVTRPRPGEAHTRRPASPALPVPAPLPPGESTWATEAAPAPVAAATPASAASATPEGRLLDSAATRAAIRQIGRQPLLQERAAAATQIPIERTDTALARGVAESSVPDCMKDPAAASGQIGPIALGGILGLPFLAARVATGKCAK